jgi:hypothetical protein
MPKEMYAHMEPATPPLVKAAAYGRKYVSNRSKVEKLPTDPKRLVSRE